MSTIIFAKEGREALDALTKDMKSLSVTELRLFILIMELVIQLIKQKDDVSEYSEIISTLKPMIAQELEFRSRDTQGTV